MSETITVNDSPLDWHEGMTVGDVLEKRRYTFKMLVIKVDGQLVKKDRWVETTIPEGADVKVIHLMSGG